MSHTYAGGDDVTRRKVIGLLRHWFRGVMASLSVTTCRMTSLGVELYDVTNAGNTYIYEVNTWKVDLRR